ncbi:MAG: response regulator [Anaerolineales bacterium]|nr:response regulator [Anaerolineales bacterium]MCB8983647.1 response regulator [Ardenticatenaceae bacterium]
MNRLQNASIRSKILLLLFVILALQIAVAGVGIGYLRQTNRTLQSIIDVQTENIALANQINTALVSIHRAEKNMLLVANDSDLQKQINDAATLQQQVESDLAQLRTQADAQSQVLLDQFYTDYRVFIANQKQVQQLVENGYGQLQPGEVWAQTADFERANNLSLGNGRQAYDRAETSLQALVQLIQDKLETSQTASNQQVAIAQTVMVGLPVFSVVLGFFVGLGILRSIQQGLQKLATTVLAIANGDLDIPVQMNSKDELGILAEGVNRMRTALRQREEESSDQAWLQSGLIRLNEVMRGTQEADTIAQKVLNETIAYLQAQLGAIYLLQQDDGEPLLKLTSSYAYTKRKKISNKFRLGESLVGQAALEGEQILVRHVPESYVRVTSGLGEAVPKFVAVTPIKHEGSVLGVLEVGTLAEMGDLELAYLAQMAPVVGINMVTAKARDELARALEEAQTLSEELMAQQADLEAMNAELEAQTTLLRSSEEKLKVQQEELQVVNEELEEKNESLKRQKQSMEEANVNLQKAQEEVERKAADLALASKYKSEFLANMSHELRTPLNSLLLLAHMLKGNKGGNLTQEQVESATIIYNSGQDLLSLINEILDLAKIESGRMDIMVEPVMVADVTQNLQETFGHLCAEKGLALVVDVETAVPPMFQTDRKRLEQILKNLLSNAIKFTEVGQITVTFRPYPDQHIGIAIADTGIGIAPTDHARIFEAFQQVEGGADRKFGGTGLGLSISREMAKLLGGSIQLESAPGQGSTFTLVLPLAAAYRKPEPLTLPSVPLVVPPVPPAPPARRPLPTSSLPDDRDTLTPGDHAILIVEDDTNFARLVAKQCQAKGFKTLLSTTGENGLELARKHYPAAIILDIRLPGMNGLEVLETLKRDPALRHIPVHIMSVEESASSALQMGAVGYLVKPVSQDSLEDALRRLQNFIDRPVKELLLVEDDAALSKSVEKLFSDNDVNLTAVALGRDAIQAISHKNFDCVILDLRLPDMNGFQILETLAADKSITLPPIIVYTGKELTAEEIFKLRQYAESIIIKGVRSEDRLLDEVSLFLHRTVSKLPAVKQQMIARLHDDDAVFKDRQVMIVDDDMRNVFALSKLLEERGLRLLRAENGQKALKILETETPDLVLMDIMMPVMDGYETIKRIRAQKQFQTLPIIALTAKAMPFDRDKIVAAGASDYLAKPVDVPRLLSMMRVWMYR